MLSIIRTFLLLHPNAVGEATIMLLILAICARSSTLRWLIGRAMESGTKASSTNHDSRNNGILQLGGADMPLRATHMSTVLYWWVGKY